MRKNACGVAYLMHMLFFNISPLYRHRETLNIRDINGRLCAGTRSLCNRYTMLKWQPHRKLSAIIICNYIKICINNNMRNQYINI